MLPVEVSLAPTSYMKVLCLAVDLDLIEPVKCSLRNARSRWAYAAQILSHQPPALDVVVPYWNPWLTAGTKMVSEQNGSA